MSDGRAPGSVPTAPSPVRSSKQQPKPRGGLNKHNVWEAWTKGDAKDRSHIQPMPVKELWLRVAQAALAVVFLVMASFSAFTLDLGNAAGFSLSFFVFSLTVVYFVLYGVAVLAEPVIYHWIAHVVLESILVIFWLAAWATLASYASELNLAGAGASSPVTGISRREAGPPAPPAGPAAIVSRTGTTTTSVLAGSAASTRRAAEILIGVSAGVGALIWVLFVATLIMTAIGAARHRASRTGKQSSRREGAAIPRGSVV